MNAMEFVKAHPVPIGIGVVLLVLLLSRSSGGSVSSSAASNAGSYAYSSQIAGINSQTAVALGAQSVDRAKIAAAAADSRTNSAASLFATIAGVTAQMGMNDSNNASKAVSGAFARADNNQQFENNLKLGEQTINAGIRMNSDKLAAAQIAMETDNNFKLSAIGAQTAGNLAALGLQGKSALEQLMASISGNFNLASLGANTSIALKDRDVASAAYLKDRDAATALSLFDKNTSATLEINKQNNAFVASNLPSILQHEENVVKINGQNQLAIVTQQTKAANTSADAAAHTAKSNDSKGWVSTIANVIGSFF